MLDYGPVRALTAVMLHQIFCWKISNAFGTGALRA